MIRALRDLKLRQNDCVVQSRRYLAHTAAVRLNRLTILVGTCQFVSVCRIQRSDRFIDGKFLARIKQCTIDLAGCIGDVVAAVLTGILVIRRIASHHIRDLLQICLLYTSIMIYSGVRIGELLDLEKKDIHLDERWFYVKESKTEAGIREVPIAEKIVPFFEYWICLLYTSPRLAIYVRLPSV